MFFQKKNSCVYSVIIKILQQVNGGDNFSLPPSFDMKAFKAEILKEMRSEITKAKNEIIDGEYR